jgi:DMSO reductase anchor subunit
LVPGAFASDYTKPTTSYVSGKPFPRNCKPADVATLRLEPAHWPLVWMLVLTQAAAGVFGAVWLVVLNSATLGAAVRVLSVAGCLLLLGGLGASVFHLGRPLGAWRAFLGWRKSWMSREIIAFAVFAALASGLAFGPSVHLGPRALSILSAITAGCGFLAVICSAMIYVDTRRAAWNGPAVFGRFLGTALLLGASSSACFLTWAALLVRPPLEDAGRFAAGVATVIRVVLFAWEMIELKRALREPTASGYRFAQTLSTQLAGLIRMRVVLFSIATVFGMASMALSGPFAAGFATVSLACTLAGQIAERYSFFVASAGPGMPGGVAG